MVAAIEQLNAALCVGLLGASLLGREEMRAALAARGLDVALDDSLAGYLYNLNQHPAVDVLLVDLDEAAERDLDALEQLLDKAPAPMVFCDASARPDNRAWMVRLAEKLHRAATRPSRMPGEPLAAAAAPVSVAEPAVPSALPATLRPETVWVLGASFGGPEAVKRFLGAMAEAPPAAFIIAQHIGEGFVEVMAQQLSRSSAFQVVPAGEGDQISHGRVYIAPVERRLGIDEQGRVRLGEETRRLSYAPSIDSVMEEVAQRYGPNSGAIIFSGMGDDGARGCQAVAAAGGLVWAQDAASCAIDSMPSCARSTGAVVHSAPPEVLARDLAAHLARAPTKWRAEHE